MFNICCYLFRLPEKYWNLTLPHKLPPKKQPLSVTGLPMLGYLEQTVASAIIKSLTAVGGNKPKHPFLSATRSALVYVAFHLKGKQPQPGKQQQNKINTPFTALFWSKFCN